MRPGEIGWALVVIVFFGGLLWVDGDATQRRAFRATRQGEREATVRLLGTADLFLSSSSRAVGCETSRWVSV
jgi:hypothetical protein